MTHPRPRSLIAVDGIDGSGKSVLAKQLIAAAIDSGIGAVLLSADDFRRPVDWVRPDRSEAQVYYDEYYDLPLLDRRLQEFRQGAHSLEIPTYDPARERIEGGRTIACGDTALAIVEGVFTLRMATVSTDAAVIYLRTSFSEARRRIVARDTARGRSLADVTHRITARYFPCHERYLRDLDPLTRAHVIVDNEQFQSPRIDRFDAAGMESHLAAIVARVLGGEDGARR